MGYLFPIVLVEVGDVVDDALVSQLLERLLPSEGEDLPEGDCERPHVALAAVPPLKTGIRSTSQNLHRLPRSTFATQVRNVHEQVIS
jgi:hypothetical protein